LNPPLRVTTSVPVVTVTLRAPVDVRDEIVIFAVALVALATVTLFTVIPAPKLAVVVPCRKWVDCPVMFTDRVAPCCPEFGLRFVNTGVLVVPVTANELVAVTTSPPVVTVTSRAPNAAAAEIVILAVALVGLATVKLFTVIPEPKFAVVVPCAKFVDAPDRLTETVAPC
jgi:hypothetical protein